MEKFRDVKNKSRRNKPSVNDKTAKEMTKSNSYKKYSLHDDINSDFTVLDLHKDVDEDFHDISADQNRSSVKFHGGRALKPINRNRKSSTVSTVDEVTDSEKKDMNVTLMKLEKLLGQEPNLVKKDEIFHCIGTMRSLLGCKQSCGDNNSTTREKVNNSNRGIQNKF